MRRELCVYPEDQAATTGWSSRRLANLKLARTSSSSRSGISLTICSGESPFARRSKTSLTRIRIPRMQGRPHTSRDEDPRTGHAIRRYFAEGSVLPSRNWILFRIAPLPRYPESPSHLPVPNEAQKVCRSTYPTRNLTKDLVDLYRASLLLVWQLA